MKKLFSFMLTLVMIVACLHGTAFAEKGEPVESYETPGLVPYAYSFVDDMKSVPIRANTNLSFTNLTKGYAQKSSSTYYITSGTDKLKVHSLTWTPTGQNLSVAFINAQTGDTYAVAYSGGSVSNKIISTTTIPTGEYYVAVVNYDGPSAVTGALSYSFV